MKEEYTKPFITVFLKENAFFSDGIPIPKRFLHRPFTVLSVGQKTVLIDGIFAHVPHSFYVSLEEMKDLCYTMKNNQILFKGDCFETHPKSD